MRIISSRIAFLALRAFAIFIAIAAHAHARPSQSDPAVVSTETAMNPTAPSRPPLSETASGGDHPRAKGTTVFSLPPKPAGMSDAEYAKLLNHTRARQMTEPERNQFWESIQKLWAQMIERIRQAAKRFAEFLNRLNRGPAAGGAAPPGVPDREDPLFTRRVAKGDPEGGSPAKRRIRPEEHGLTADGSPRTQWSGGDGYRPVMIVPVESLTKSVPALIPRPVETTGNRQEVPAGVATENEVKTAGSTAPYASKKGTGIHVTDH